MNFRIILIWTTVCKQISRSRSDICIDLRNRWLYILDLIILIFDSSQKFHENIPKQMKSGELTQFEVWLEITLNKHRFIHWNVLQSRSLASILDLAETNFTDSLVFQIIFLQTDSAWIVSIEKTGEEIPHSYMRWIRLDQRSLSFKNL